MDQAKRVFEESSESMNFIRGMSAYFVGDEIVAFNHLQKTKIGIAQHIVANVLFHGLLGQSERSLDERFNELQMRSQAGDTQAGDRVNIEYFKLDEMAIFFDLELRKSSLNYIRQYLIGTMK